MDINTIMFLIVVGVFLSFGVAGIIFEKLSFNNGICRKCGKKLIHFDTDSQGARGYSCMDCHEVIWISYPLIDKNKNK